MEYGQNPNCLIKMVHKLLGKVKLFVLDLDGTSLGGTRPYSKFTKNFCKFLDYISDNGCLWAINTTWDINGQWELVLNSPVKSRPIFLMGELGHSLAKVSKNSPIMIKNYNNMIEKKTEWFNKKYMYKIIKDIINKICLKKIHFYGHLFAVVVNDKDINKLQLYAKNFLNMTEITFYFNPPKTQVMIYPAFLNKGNILKTVEKNLKVLPKEVVIAGDSFIDLPMMVSELSKYLICPFNAEDIVKGTVLKNSGVVASKPYSEGVIEGFWKLDAGKS